MLLTAITFVGFGKILMSKMAINGLRTKKGIVYNTPVNGYKEFYGSESI